MELNGGNVCFAASAAAAGRAAESDVTDYGAYRVSALVDICHCYSLELPVRRRPSSAPSHR